MWWEHWLLSGKVCQNQEYSLAPGMQQWNPRPTRSGLSPVISGLVIVPENWTAPRQSFPPCPLPPVATGFVGLPLFQPQPETWDYFRTGGGSFRKIFLRCRSIAEIPDLGARPPGYSQLPLEILWSTCGHFLASLPSEQMMLCLLGFRFSRYAECVAEDGCLTPIPATSWLPPLPWPFRVGHSAA